MEPSEVAGVFRRAAAGDKAAWEALVVGFGPMIWGVAIAHRLGTADAGEVVQTTWLRLLENFDRIEHPERLGGWLAKTARHEALRMLRLRGREIPIGDDETTLDRASAAVSTPETAVLTSDRDQRLWAAFRGLDARCQMLLRLVVLTAPTYSQVAEEMGMPIGSIGPTRARCLKRLRKLLEEGAGD